MNPKMQKNNKYYNNITTKNRFDILTDEEDETSDMETNEVDEEIAESTQKNPLGSKIKKPPPLVIHHT